MSEERVSIDRRIAGAVRDVAKALIARGMEPAAAKELAEKHRSRLVAGEAGPIYVTIAGGGFYPASFDAPFKELVAELYHAAPAEVKFGGPSEEDQRAAKEQLRRSGMY
jgi:hypothetical protein